MFSRGTASKESEHRRHERRIELGDFRDTEVDDTACIHSLQRRNFDHGVVRTKTKRRHSYGTCFRSSNRGTGGTSWGVDRARRVRRALYRPVEWRMANSWNQDRDWFPLSERKSRRNPKLQRRTAVQDRTRLVYDWDLLWDIIMTLLHSPIADVAPPSPPTLARLP